MDPIELWRYLLVALGIGLVIFVHEGGHFIAARLCKVRVEVFSLGFGPRLLGFRRGATLYQLAAVPFGGYVRMAGEETYGEGRAPAPDELRAKSVGQRFFIYSGGVLMNVAFGLVVFPLVLAWGVPFTEPVLGEPVPGGPAWEAGLEPGTRVLSVNGKPVVGFSYIAQEVALGPPEATVLEVLPPGAEQPRQVTLVPRYIEEVGFRSILVAPPLDPEHTLAVERRSPAEQAGLRDGDRLVGIEGARAGLPLIDQLLVALRSGEPVALEVLRDGAPVRVVVAPSTETRGPPRLGVAPLGHRVAALRSSALVRELGLREGDRILEVDGAPVRGPLDLELALLAVAQASEARPLTMRVRRPASGAADARGGLELELSAPAPDRAAALALSDDVALAGDLDSNAVVVSPGSAAAAAGLRDGDRIVSMAGARVARWEDVSRLAKEHARAPGGIPLTVERPAPGGGAPQVLQLSAKPAPIAAPSYGFGVREATYVYQATSFAEAIRIGVKSSWKFVVDAWLTLKRILLGQVSGDNIGGIITIGAVSYSWVSVGIAKLLFFLCMLSLNLAFLNVLPIPVLDGGHLFFLVIEKLKGSPVSERVFGYSQMVGLVLILSLMIYVTYNDLMRWVFPG